MANKKSKKEPFQWERFIAAKKRAKISITKLGSKDDGIGWSEKTIRRAKADGEISPEILEALAKRLDIDPDYLRGKYDHFYDLIADGFEEKQREIYLKKMLDPGRYPYYMGKNQVAGHRCVVGYASNAQGHSVEINYADDIQQELTFCKPTHGKSPQKSNEIATTELALKALGVKPEIGASVPLEIELRGKIYHYDMVLSGWWEASNDSLIL